MKKWEISKYFAEQGHKGGTARAKNLTPKQLKDIAKMGAKARWAKAKAKKEETKNE